MMKDDRKKFQISVRTSSILPPCRTRRGLSREGWLNVADESESERGDHLFAAFSECRKERRPVQSEVEHAAGQHRYLSPRHSARLQSIYVHKGGEIVYRLHPKGTLMIGSARKVSQTIGRDQTRVDRAKLIW